MTISGVSCLLFFNFSSEIDKRTEIEEKRNGINSDYKSAQTLAQSLSFVVHCRQRQDGPSVVGLNPILALPHHKTLVLGRWNVKHFCQSKVFHPDCVCRAVITLGSTAENIFLCLWVLNTNTFLE